MVEGGEEEGGECVCVGGGEEGEVRMVRAREEEEGEEKRVIDWRVHSGAARV